MATSAMTLLLVGGTPAFADDVSNGLDGTVDATVEVMTLVPGATGSTTMRVIPANNDGKSGCNLTGSTVLTAAVASSNTAVATVTPASITFAACNTEYPVTVKAGTTSGTARVTLTQTANTTDGTFSLAPATFDVVVTAPAKSATTTTLSCAAPVVYSGSAQTPCSATTTGTNGFTASPTLAYSANTEAGTASVTATYAGDATHLASSDTKTFTIAKASSTTTLTCKDVTYTGSSLQPCSATVTGVGTGLGTATVTYTNNTDAGTASADAVYAGDANHTGSKAGQTFTIGQAAATCTITGFTGTYDGKAHGLSGSCTGAGGAVVGSVDLGATHTDAGSYDVPWSFSGGTNYADQTGTVAVTIARAQSTTTVTCPKAVTYDGSAQTPCSATVTGAGGLSTTAGVTYGANTDAGTATASASYAGGRNHEASSDSASFVITKAPSTTTVTCPGDAVEYTGSALTPCSAAVTGVGGLSTTAPVSYSDNIDAGTAHAGALYLGDTNHSSSSDATTFTIAPAASLVTVTCPGGPFTYTGKAQEPCSADVTGAGGLDRPLTVTYSGNVNAGTATASASYAGDRNHVAATGSKDFTIAKASSTTTVTCTGPVTYTGGTQKPCTASASGVAMDDVTGLEVTYADNTNAGEATATATWDGDDNHKASTGTAVFTIAKAGSTSTISCPESRVYTGSPLTPCTGAVTGIGGLDEKLTPSYENNVVVGTATAGVTYPGDVNHDGSKASTTFAVTKAPVDVTITCPGSVVYNGTAQTPCSALVTGAGGLSESVPVAYPNDVTGAGTVSVSAAYEGDANHQGGSATGSYVIAQAPSTVVIVCDGPSVYTGSAVTPCAATAQGVGMSAVTLRVDYTGNVDAGTAGASATWEGDRNHTGSTKSVQFAVAKATSSTVVTCPAGPFPFTGSPITPACTARATGAGGLDVAVTPVTFANNTAVGTATASASYAGDGNHTGSSGSATFSIAAWNLKGFYQPVDMGGVLNTVKNGSTVPLKFNVFSGGSELTATSAVKTFTQTKIACDGSAAEDAIEVTTTGGTSLRYDATGGQFVQNWQTPKTAGVCYRVTMTTQDGSTISAQFKLK
ncbi:PxKF domain-containing protein [Phycicoccus flavus]|uniref:PxKF domain-containing protein n=1 Tax=Phycicoccus flavus TaxID=2502783 RepID=UPI000FEB9AD8|nr:PxKF domain-containing protein [Phycicoccus flavus]NHA66583.1 hypothetical protein [Phycicoccus flavus]